MYVDFWREKKSSSSEVVMLCAYEKTKKNIVYTCAVKLVLGILVYRGLRWIYSLTTPLALDPIPQNIEVPLNLASILSHIFGKNYGVQYW